MFSFFTRISRPKKLDQNANINTISSSSSSVSCVVEPKVRNEPEFCGNTTSNNKRVQHKNKSAEILSSFAPDSPLVTTDPRVDLDARSPERTMSFVPKGSSVKPCGHGTVAISPKVPTPTSSRRCSNASTPPASPKAQHRGEPFLGLAPQAQQDIESRETKRLLEDNKKNLVNQEAKFQGQLNDLSKQLAQRDVEGNQLRFQMEELQRDVFAKSAGMDRLQAELQAAHKESEFVKQRLKHLEEELLEYRHKNANLSDELAIKTEKYTKCESESQSRIHQLEQLINELKARITQLEAQIKELETQRQSLQLKHTEILQQRDKEKQIIEQSLQEAIKEKDSVAKKWQEEFERLRTVNLMKEQTLLDDFEFQLREVHKNCKEKLIDKEKSLEERLREAYRDAEVKMKIAQDMMDEVEHLKGCRSEVQELKRRQQEYELQVQHLKQQQEQMKVSESNLLNDSKKLRSLIDLEKENLQHMQRMHRQELNDKERWLHNTLQEKKTEIAVYWEERLLQEIGRLKWELEQLYMEEKQKALENLRRNKDEEFDNAKKIWDKKLKDCLKEINILKRTLDEKERYYQNELIDQQTLTDREILELRRTMDKIDNAHHERFEKLMQDCELEIEKLNLQHAEKLNEVELAHKSQSSTFKDTVDLLREQMEKESQEKIENLIAQHRSELDTQWANLVHQKTEAIKLLEQDYVQKYKTLEEQFYTQQKSHECREVELLKSIDSLKNEMSTKESTIEDLQSNVDTLEGGVQVLNNEIAHQNEELAKNRKDADQKIRGLQDVLIKLQALVQQERDEFQSKLQQQQKQSQQTIDHLHRKVSTLTKLFEEVRSRYERRESRQEDLNIISDLRQVIAEQEKDLACMNEEKRFYQMQLMKYQKHNQQEDDDEEENEVADSENPECIIEEDDDEFMDSVEYHNGGSYTVTFPGVNAIVRPQKETLLSIPPTIPECDDCDEE